MTHTQKLGHLAAILTIILWGTTFVSTKILLEAYQPVEILFFRFVMGVIALIIIYPKPLKGTSLRQELIFAAAGLCGICLYYLLENIALTYTMASNVGVITSIAPCFTAIVAYFAHVDEDAINKKFFFGFLVALAGIFLISFNGAELQLNPAGDVLALLAALSQGERTADQLVELTQIPAKRVLSALTMLQIQAAVAENPGRRFSALVELEE